MGTPEIYDNRRFEPAASHILLCCRSDGALSCQGRVVTPSVFEGHRGLICYPRQEGPSRALRSPISAGDGVTRRWSPTLSTVVEARPRIRTLTLVMPGWLASTSRSRGADCGVIFASCTCSTS